MGIQKASSSPGQEAPVERDTVRIVALGGLGEVGMNCTLIECNDDIVIVDCGVTFPENGNFGVDLLLPDWNYVLDNADRIVGIVLTHGHEDHIGALPFLLYELDVPVYGTALTLAMVRHKLEEHGLAEEVDLEEVFPREEVDLGEFGLEVVRVNHSIPDAVAVALHTCLGTILMTGDFRVDYTPYKGEAIDLGRLAEFGEDGVLCLLGDSTNVFKPGFSVSESEVARQLHRVVAEAQQRVVVALFSSNLYRVQALLDIAHAEGRKVLLVGRSLMNNVGFGRECGHIELPSDDLLVSPRTASRLPPKDLLVLTTGSQGEPRSGLARMAFDERSKVPLQAGDCIIFSARKIPGNELSISRLMNALWSKGLQVITQDDAPIHTTGHGYRDELKLMLTLTSPHYFVPAHGETRMLMRHAALAKELGIDDTFVLHNGEILEIDPEGARRCGQIQTGRVFVDNGDLGDVDDVILRDRRKMARSGVLVVWAVVDTRKLDLVSGPEVLQRGALDQEVSQEALEEAGGWARESFDQLHQDGLKSMGEIREALRVAVRRYFKKKHGRTPMVIPLVVEL